MPSRARNRNTLEKKIIRTRRIFWYRFALHLSDISPKTFETGAWGRRQLEEGKTPAYIADRYKTAHGYDECNPWPATDKEVDDYINLHLPRKTQLAKGLVL